MKDQLYRRFLTLAFACICFQFYIFRILINLADFTERKKYNKIICAKQIKNIKKWLFKFNMLFCVEVYPSWHKIQLVFLQLPFSLCIIIDSPKTAYLVDKCGLPPEVLPPWSGTVWVERSWGFRPRACPGGRTPAWAPTVQHCVEAGDSE